MLHDYELRTNQLTTNTKHRRRLSLAGFLLLLFGAVSSHAQPLAFHEKVTHDPNDLAPAKSRDFWFAPGMEYYDDQVATYTLFLSSSKNTVARIQLADSEIQSIPLMANAMHAFAIPPSWEIRSSSVVENKGIHLWSDDADLNAVEVTHLPYSGDAMHLIPTNELGLDYVLAAAPGEDEMEYEFSDLVSEFSITSTHDSTIVTITPTADLRLEDSAGSCYTCTIHPKETPFVEFLSRGQAVNYKAITDYLARFDLSGTVIHSNWPLAVVGGSIGTSIPSSTIYADYVSEMIPPIDGWGTAYFTVPFDSAIGGSSFLITGSIANQIIYGTVTDSGKSIVCKLGQSNIPFWKYNHNLPTKWESDQPFLLVQYMNGTNVLQARGAPAMMIVPPVSRFASSSIFVIPDTNGRAPTAYGGSPFYDWYANVIVNHSSGRIILDGTNIDTFPKRVIDSVYDIYTMPHIQPGAHSVVADSGVSVDVYGFGEDESMAYGTSAGLEPKMHIAFAEDRGCLRAVITDSQSRIARVVLDSASNLSYDLDAGFYAGISQSTFVRLCSNNLDCAGTASVSIYDSAETRTLVEITYTANSLNVQSNDFPPTALDSTNVMTAVTLTNPGPCAITLDSIFVMNRHEDPGARVFWITPNVNSNGPPITFAPGALHSFSVSFHPQLLGADSARFVGRETDGSFVSTILRGSTLITEDVRITPDKSTNGVLVYPNPAGKTLTLDYTTTRQSPATFELFTLLGTSIYRWQSGAVGDGTHRETLDVSALAAGSYIYRFECAGEVTSGKIEIVR